MCVCDVRGRGGTGIKQKELSYPNYTYILVYKNYAHKSRRLYLHLRPVIKKLPDFDTKVT